MIECPCCGTMLADDTRSCVCCDFDLAAYFRTPEGLRDLAARSGSSAPPLLDLSSNDDCIRVIKATCPDCGMPFENVPKKCPRCGFKLGVFEAIRKTSSKVPRQAKATKSKPQRPSGDPALFGLERWRSARRSRITESNDSKVQYLIDNIGETVDIEYHGDDYEVEVKSVYRKEGFDNIYLDGLVDGEDRTFNLKKLSIPGIGPRGASLGCLKGCLVIIIAVVLVAWLMSC